MKLYELSENYARALDVMTDPEANIDNQTIEDTLEALDDNFDDKAINVARVIATIEAEALAIAEVEKRQADRRKKLESKADWLRGYLLFNMHRVAKDKLSAPDISIALAKTPPAVKVIDASLIPFDFYETKSELVLSKKRIKEAGGCPGAVVESGLRVSIK